MKPRPILIALAIVVLVPVLLVVATVLLVQSEWGERWLETRVSERIEREVEVEGINVDLGWPPIVNFAQLRIGNPSWAKTPSLIDARSLAAHVEILPLLRRKLVIPHLAATRATAGLEQDGERATWRFGSGESEPSPFVLGRIHVEDGHIVYRDELEKTALDVYVKGSAGSEGQLEVAASGRFRGEPAKGNASIPSLDPFLAAPIRLVANATVGGTAVTADGAVASDLDTLDLKLKVAGQTLKDLRKLFGMNLPDTPPYRVAGQLRHAEAEWVFSPFDGAMGDSDLRGEVTYRTGGKRPLFVARLQSKLLDLDDLGPVIGTPPKTGPGETASAAQRRKAAEKAQESRVLPTLRISTAGWDEMDADVRLDAKRVMRPKQLPFDALVTRAVLNDSVLRLDPLSFTFAGGKVAGPVTVDARVNPPRGDVQLDIQGLHLGRLFPELESTSQSLGTLYGRAKLVGRGDSIADLVASSNGQLILAIDGGRFSLLLVEILGIDIAEALQMLGTRNRQVTLRCAVADLAVKDGIATPQTFIIDTTDTIVAVTGTIDFRQERLDLVFKAEPKDMSIFAMRSPIHLEGSFKDPKIRPEAGPIVARVAGAALLAAINPVLALLPFIETGPGKDSDCGKLIAQANTKGAVKKTSSSAKALK